MLVLVSTNYTLKKYRRSLRFRNPSKKLGMGRMVDRKHEKSGVVSFAALRSQIGWGSSSPLSVGFHSWNGKKDVTARRENSQEIKGKGWIYSM
ncbi:uncharacterized protein [Centruroides vittatus]|uniref:uncharacterized protein n=1 Tax=Centruroides vittatus TaxID=120091 RepID=UPI0035102D57